MEKITSTRRSGRSSPRNAKLKPMFCAVGVGMSWLVLATPAQSSSLTWNAGGVDQNVSNAANWGGSAPSTGDAITLGSNFDGVPVLNVDENLSRLLFHDTSGSPQARTLDTLASPKTLTLTSLTGDGAIEVFDNFTETINANIVLSSASTSTFAFSPDNPLPALIHAGVKLNGTLSGGATNNNLTTGNSRPFLLDFSSAGAAIGTGNTSIPSGVRLRIANTNQIFSGNLAVAAGTIEWAGASDFTMAFGTGAGQLNATTRLDFAAMGGTRGVNIGGSGSPSTITVGSGLTPSLGFGSIDADGTLEFKNPITATPGLNIYTTDGPAAIEGRVMGAISIGAGNAINFLGNGTVRLSAAITTQNQEYNVGGGTVLVDQASALGAAGNQVLMFDPASTASSNAAILTNAAINITQGVWIFPFSTGVATLGGNTADASTFSGNILLGTGTARNLEVTAATGGTVTFSGAINKNTVAANITKSGAGKVVFANANTYGGTTTVNAGTLVADNNNAFNTGAVTVNTGGKLETATGRTITNAITVNSGGAIGGYGTFNPTGGVTLASGAHLSPGDSIGTVTFGSNGLTMTNGAVYDWEWTSAAQDLTSVTGLLTLSGTLTLDVTKFGAGIDPPFLLPTNYVIMTYGTLSNTANWNVILPSGWASTGVVVDAPNHRLLLSGLETPEPATAGLLAAGGCLLLGRRRGRGL